MRRIIISNQSKTLTLISQNPNPQIQHRNYAKWAPYKPQSRPKTHRKLYLIKTLKSHLRSSYLVTPFPSHGFTSNLSKPFKTPLSNDPTSAKLVFVKNSLVSMALGGTHFEKLGSCLKGMNSLMFVKDEDVVGPTLSGVRGFLKEGKMEFNEFSGGVLDGCLYGFKDLEVLEKLPPRAQSNVALLGSLFGPTSTFMAVLEGLGVGPDQGGAVEGGADEGGADEGGAVEGGAGAGAGEDGVGKGDGEKVDA